MVHLVAHVPCVDDKKNSFGDFVRKGAVPIPYIVALIFAIIVIAVIAFMFFTQTGIFSGTASKEYCEARKLQYCWDWSIAGEQHPPQDGWGNYEPKCKDVVVEPTVPECSSLHVPIS